MSQLLRIFKTAKGLSWRRKVWLLVMYPLSGLVRLVALCAPFRYVSRLLGCHYRNHQLCVLVSDYQLLTAHEIGRTIVILDKYTPWKTNCMVEGILARIWLGAYGIPYVFYLGTQLTKDASEPMKAHAWVGVGPRIIVGNQGHQRYTIVGTFVSKRLAKSIHS